jgi:hypothetical protein
VILVQRHGGQKRYHWRTVYIGTDEQKAQQRYEAERAHMRQGSVRIMQDGIVTLLDSVPAARPRR